ncbi:MAG TPA: hypothetical protein VEY91_07610 [Candidatus Limnocylindria bacterium]|nr:hypothetical protein [Candidatus Limnocylindria bacterium]
MTSRTIVRERTLWITAIAVLATALSWWSAIALGLWVHATAGSQGEVYIVAKTLVRAGWLLAREHGTVLVGAPLLACGLVAVAQGLWRAASSREGVRHA